MNPFNALNDSTPDKLPTPVEGKTNYAFQREGRTYYFQSFEDVKVVADFYRGLREANRRVPGWMESTSLTGGPVSSALQRDRDAVANLCNRQQYQGSTAESRNESRNRPQPKVLTERLAPEDRSVPKPEPEEVE